MNEQEQHLRDAIAARATFAPQSARIATEHARHVAAIAECDTEIAGAEAPSPDDDAATRAWLEGGAQGEPPVPDAKARAEKIRRAEIAKIKRAAHVAAAARLEAESTAIAGQLAEAERAVARARARMFAAAWVARVARLRALHDESDVLESVAAGLFRQAHALDPVVTGEIANELEALRVTWVNERDRVNQSAVNAQLTEALAAVPA